MSKAGTRALYNHVVKSIAILCKAHRVGHVFPSYRTVQRRLEKTCHQIDILTEHVEISTGRVVRKEKQVSPL